MDLTNNTILITGGSSGIGLELSRQLVAKNKVIICGRSEKALLKAQAELPKLVVYPCDLSDENQCDQMVKWIQKEHPTLNVLINNAAIVHKEPFLQTANITEKAEQEMRTNFLAPIRLIHLLYPMLQQNEQASIINVTTGLIYTPRADYPFYNATKAALHSFTQVLRKQTEASNVEVIEVMFPAVKTPWHKGSPPKIAISCEEAVTKMIKGLVKGKSEIRVGGAKLLYVISRVAPGFAFKKVNEITNEK
ncbi:SDR family oxidoreductase [Marinoscillum furvescens]|uniref:Putative oxidoreductase n=1 Tax=Marinoscillum furvescens DSM 4134 TaxID=1122208 RepID=A0A3D9KWV0_MARFU|nr:SDR family NAD(P)-dependent oxidoreductase [Marinoscillum furvescens]RED92986.1 putative oxidoreductase [Marinoscillum furvescens DSM 4134]